jgi:hypothetical protein
MQGIKPTILAVLQKKYLIVEEKKYSAELFAGGD